MKNSKNLFQISKEKKPWIVSLEEIPSSLRHFGTMFSGLISEEMIKNFMKNRQ